MSASVLVLRFGLSASTKRTVLNAKLPLHELFKSHSFATTSRNCNMLTFSLESLFGDRVRFYKSLLTRSFSTRLLNWNVNRVSTVREDAANFSDKQFDPYKTVIRFMAGHAKWQNVKNVKAAKDMQKSRTANRIARLARNAVREGGPDPKLNGRLADVMREAHKFNIPMSTLENAMKKGSSGKTKFGTVEITGPGGCLIVLEYETDNISTTRHDIKLALRKFNRSIMQGEGRWRASFDEKGILKVPGRTDDQPICPEKALDSAIIAGAEDVQLKKDEEEEEQRIYLEFFCAAAELHSVKKELENMAYMVEEAYVGYIPHSTIELSPDDLQEASNMLEALDEIPEVIRIYENIQ